jgi:hypothetical protein
MKSFGEFKEKIAIEEALIPELKEILKNFDEASKKAEELNMKQTLQAIENARQEIITLAGK